MLHACFYDGDVGDGAGVDVNFFVVSQRGEGGVQFVAGSHVDVDRGLRGSGQQQGQD